MSKTPPFNPIPFALNVFTGIGVLAVVISCFIGWRAASLKQAQGTVIEWRENKEKFADNPCRSRLSYPYVKYTIGAREYYSGRHGFGEQNGNRQITKNAKVGDTVMVYYPADNPAAGYAVVEEWERWFATVLVAVVGTVFVVISRILALTTGTSRSNILRTVSSEAKGVRA